MALSISVLPTAKNASLNQMMSILIGVLALTLAAQLRIPMLPVPLTFQSSTVILLGIIYGPRQGLYIVSSYLIAGACGLPVFEGFTNGFVKFFSPTFGYLLGFLPAVWLSGYFDTRGWMKNTLTGFVAACLSTSMIFGCGIVFLATTIGLAPAIAVGLLPFVFSELLKLCAVTAVARFL